MTENRKHRRVATALRCWCECENVTFYARVGNLSEGGLFIRTSTPLERGTRAVVRLEVHGQTDVQAQATVVWARMGGGETHPGMGLRFETLSEPASDQLRQLVHAELSRGRA